MESNVVMHDRFVFIETTTPELGKTGLISLPSGVNGINYMIIAYEITINNGTWRYPYTSSDNHHFVWHNTHQLLYYASNNEVFAECPVKLLLFKYK